MNSPSPFELTGKRPVGTGQIVRTISAMIAVIVLAANSFAQQSSRIDLIRVEIGGLHSDKGQVICALFSSPRDFPKNGDKAVAHTRSAIANGRAVCEFSSVAPGKYAVSVFHDENSNGKMDTNFMGIPREGVGASNNAIGHLGPPKFNDAAFSYAGGQLDLKITVTYL